MVTGAAAMATVVSDGLFPADIVAPMKAEPAVMSAAVFAAA
jgi:hypothetical protein